MKVLRVHAPGADPRLGPSIEAAVRAFNGGLDIRLRFLAIGIEEQVTEAPDAATAAETVGGALGTGASAPGADAVLLLGGGEAAVAAASAAVRARVPVLRVGAGERTGPGADAARAVDRLSAVLLVHAADAAAALRAEDAAAAVEVIGAPDDPAIGERIVRALSRARRRWPC
jgi:hypothetical protein